jgi:hypothetical protein
MSSKVQSEGLGSRSSRGRLEAGGGARSTLAGVGVGVAVVAEMTELMT